MTLVSFRLFRKNLGNLQNFLGKLFAPSPPWQKIARTPMLQQDVKMSYHIKKHCKSLCSGIQWVLVFGQHTAVYNTWFNRWLDSLQSASITNTPTVNQFLGLDLQCKKRSVRDTGDMASYGFPEIKISFCEEMISVPEHQSVVHVFIIFNHVVQDPCRT